MCKNCGFCIHYTYHNVDVAIFESTEPNYYKLNIRVYCVSIKKLDFATFSNTSNSFGQSLLVLHLENHPISYSGVVYALIVTEKPPLVLFVSHLTQEQVHCNSKSRLNGVCVFILKTH